MTAVARVIEFPVRRMAASGSPGLAQQPRSFLCPSCGSEYSKLVVPAGFYILTVAVVCGKCGGGGDLCGRVIGYVDNPNEMLRRSFDAARRRKRNMREGTVRYWAIRRGTAIDVDAHEADPPSEAVIDALVLSGHEAGLTVAQIAETLDTTTAHVNTVLNRKR